MMGMGGGGGAAGGLGIGRGGADRINVPDSWDDMAGYNPEVTRRAFAYVGPYRLLAGLALALTLFAAIMVAVGPVLTKVAIDSYIATGSIPGMTLFLGLTLAVYGVAFLANWAQLYITTRVGQDVLRTIRNEIFDHLQRLPLTYFDRVPSGVVVSRLINDVQTMNDLLTNGMLQALSDVFTLVLTLVLMLILDARLALVTFAVLPFMFVAVWIFTEKAKLAYRVTRITVAKLTGELAESFSAVRVVQAFAHEDASQAQFDAINDENRIANIKANTLSSALLPVVELCNAGAFVAVIAFGGYLIVNGQSSLGVLVAFLAYVTRFFQPIRTLTQFYNQLQAATAGAEKVFELLDEKVTLAEAEHPLTLSHVRGEVEFRDVTFSYGREPVLQDVSFHAAPGEMIAMVGHTGAGKTTVASLLARFYDPVEGEVLLDGVDLRELSFKTLRTSVALVLQDNFLFSGTIADNIRYSRETATDGEMIAAARVANADEFIERLPQGYQTIVQERASNLSLGQRQLVAIARAVLADPQVLILDEATSNIDSHTELLVQDALHELLQGRTSLVIAHRLSTIRAADQVLVLDGGKIIERGRHEELLRKQGFYYRLYQQQFADTDSEVPSLAQV
jgi:ABC-type multidrug transport system fused ATPase/permease subunit